MPLAAAYACSGKATSPTSPSTGAAAAKGLPAASDGSTLKVTAPTQIGDVGADGFVANVDGIGFHRQIRLGRRSAVVEAYNESNTKVADSGPLAGTTTTLDFEARPCRDRRGEAGPWIVVIPFVPEGRIRSNEVLKSESTTAQRSARSRVR